MKGITTGNLGLLVAGLIVLGILGGYIQLPASLAQAQANNGATGDEVGFTAAPERCPGGADFNIRLGAKNELNRTGLQFVGATAAILDETGNRVVSGSTLTANSLSKNTISFACDEKNRHGKVIILGNLTSTTGRVMSYSIPQGSTSAEPVIDTYPFLGLPEAGVGLVAVADNLSFTIRDSSDNNISAVDVEGQLLANTATTVGQGTPVRFIIDLVQPNQGAAMGSGEHGMYLSIDNNDTAVNLKDIVLSVRDGGPRGWTITELDTCPSKLATALGADHCYRATWVTSDNGPLKLNVLYQATLGNPANDPIINFDDIQTFEDVSGQLTTDAFDANNAQVGVANNRVILNIA